MKKINVALLESIVNARQKGYSVPEISRNYQVSKSTASRICKNVTILPEFVKRLEDRKRTSTIVSEENWKKAEVEMSQLCDKIDLQDKALIVSALYWAEGAKRDFSFTNTDPKMVAVFLTCLRDVFGVKDEEIKVSIRIFEDLIVGEAIKFWSFVVGFDISSTASIHLQTGSKKGKLKYGMIRLRVKRSSLLLKKVTVLQKKIFNFTNPHFVNIFSS